MVFQTKKLRRADLGIGVALALAVVLTLPALYSMRSAFSVALWTVGKTEDQAQRELNGPLSAYAKQISAELPPNSCLQLVHPGVAALRAAKREYLIPNTSVLAHRLYPRAVRQVTDSREAVTGAGCGARERYVVVWVERLDTAERAQALREDVEILRANPDVRQVSDFRDDDGNTGYLFLVLGQGAGA